MKLETQPTKGSPILLFEKLKFSLNMEKYRVTGQSRKKGEEELEDEKYIKIDKVLKICQNLAEDMKKIMARMVMIMALNYLTYVFYNA